MAVLSLPCSFLTGTDTWEMLSLALTAFRATWTAILISAVLSDVVPIVLPERNSNLDGKTYQLAKNIGENHLHGGNSGFDKKVWEAHEITER